MARILAIGLLSLLLSGCGWVNSFFVGTDNSPPPAELRGIADPLPVLERWRVSVSSGSGETFTALEPAYGGGRLFVAGYRGDVSALDAATGQRIWRTDTDVPVTAGVGLSATLVLIGTPDGRVVALDRETGAERWRSTVASEVLTPPVADQGIVVVRSVDGTLTGLDERDGNRVWGYNTVLPTLTLRGASKPLLIRGLVIVGLDNGRLLLLDLPSGAPVGERIVAPPRGRTEVERLVDIDGNLRLVDSVLYLAAYQGSTSAVDLRSGEILWTRDLSSHSGLDVAGNRVFVVDTDDTVRALDRTSGTPLWQQQELLGRRLKAPVAVGGYVVVADFEGYLHWLDADSGRIRARVRADSDGLADAPLPGGDTLYALGRSGQVHAFGARPGG
jgi:outer membrane protein assembly factor BamB